MNWTFGTVIAAGALISASAMANDWRFGDGVTDERWSLISSDFALCDAGLMQSPIDLGTANARGNVAIAAEYGSAEGVLEIGEQKVQLNVPAGMTMTSGDMTFNLLQVHFHTPAEHAVDGQRDPLAAHFVHADEDGALAVLGITFREGPENSALAAILAAVGQGGDGGTVSLDLNDMLPDDFNVYRYMGSLTTPPCSEGVNWHVSDTPVTASAEQIAALREALGPSARSIQPSGNRLIVAPSQ